MKKDDWSAAFQAAGPAASSRCGRSGGRMPPVQPAGCRRSGWVVAILLLISASLHAQQAPPPPKSDEKELSDLMNVLQQETAVATKTRLNSDYVPGIVTVLEGEQLEALGIGTAWEALGLVPGIHAVMDPFGSPLVVVRGIDFPFNSGNIQILINSVPLARADAGISGSSLLIPIEQVERIEVIRGPGSVIYGDFAFMGLVNIITRRDGERVYLRGDNRVQGGGAYGTWKSGSATIAANLTHQNSDNAPVALTRAHDDRSFGVLSAENGGFTLTAEEAKRSFDPHTAAPHFDETSWTIDTRYRRDLTPKLHAEANASYLRNDLDSTVSIFQGHVEKFAASLVDDAFRRQSWLLGADYSISTIGSAAFASPPPPGRPLGPAVVLARNVDRKITGLTLQDRIDVSDKMSVTLGARHDSYSDLQSRTTPRASVVWRVNDRNIFKAQYAEGFRPPTFFELYTPPQPGLVPRYPFEVNATTELNYILKGTNHVFRATLFRTELRNLLQPGGRVVPGHTSSDGFELEWSQQVAANLKLDANASRATTSDARRGGTPDLAAANWLANLALTYQPQAGMFLGVRVDRVADRRVGDDYDLVDVTFTRKDLLTRGLSFRAGVKDAFNQHASYILVLPQNVLNLTFPGRTIWLQFSWKR
jgi:iron complex outermembrane receptor protein